MKRITIKDLANMLQISTSTVSRALSNHPDISDSVKERVKEAAETFNYHPSDFAVNFRKKSSKVIGLIIPQISMFFVPSIIQGIAAKLKTDSYKFFILSSEESVDIETENIITCCNSRVDGILISLSKETKNLDHFKIAIDLNIPVVIFDKSIKQDYFDEVIFDNIKSAEQCAIKLIESGCKKILAVYGDEKLDITENRRSAFENILKQHDIIPKNIYSPSADSAKEMIETILENHDFDGIFAMSDEVLAGINIALINKNIGLDTIKIVAISEGILPKYLNSGYDYEKNDGLKMGMVAAGKLLEKIKNTNFVSKSTDFV